MHTVVFGATIWAALDGCYTGSALDPVASHGTSEVSSDDAGAPATTGTPSAEDAGTESRASSSGAGSQAGAGLSGGSGLGAGTGASSSSSSASSSSLSASSSSSSASSSSASSAASDASANVAAVCSSGKTYSSGTGPTMEPGVPCASCHGSKFAIAGTVYPTEHEPDRCDGADVTGVTVVITDANNTTTTLTPNTVGNFNSSKALVTPFTATVTYNGKSISMTTPQTTGDCNSCHTQDGANGAPGRIVLP
jgi:hypothetical protein